MLPEERDLKHMKKRLLKLISAGIVFAAAMILRITHPQMLYGTGEFLIFESIGETVAVALFIIAYLIAGFKVIYKALRNIRYGKIFDENFLMAVASIGAFIIGEYPEAVAVMLFYRLGELFEDYAVGKSRKSIAELMNIRPDYANLKLPDGIKRVAPEEVSIGDVIVINPGEKVALDGRILSGFSTIDTAALTGESLPRNVGKGDEILSGCVNLTGLIEVEVTKAFGESTVSRILELVENATSKKAKTENFITRFAAVYTPAVVICAALLAILPPLIVPGAEFADWVYRALNFLVVSCPCALVISVPLGFFGGIGAASKAGILVKGSNYIEAVSGAEYVVMDKTGTLTEGVFEVQEIETADGFTEEEVLRAAASAEQRSSHPISVSLCRAWEKNYGEKSLLREIDSLVEIAGKGVRAVSEGEEILAGSGRLMEQFEIRYDASEAKNEAGTIVFVSVGGKYAGRIYISDKVKDDAQSAVSDLKSAKIKTVMLTGDSDKAAAAAAKKLSVDSYYAELLPADKVERVEELMTQKSEKGKLIFVGDGINDAPVLARADVGVAMGGLGSDAAIEAADVVIMDDKPSKLITLMKISRKTVSIVKQNIIFALGIKLLVLLISAFGYGNLWAAVFADVGVSVIAILNSLRVLGTNFEDNSK